MKKSQSKIFTGAKSLFVAPLFVALFLVFTSSDMAEASTNDVLQNRTTSGDYFEGEPIYYSVDKMPKYPGGKKALLAFVAQNVRYPQQAKENGMESKIYVRFVVTKSGAVEDAVIMRTSIPEKQSNSTGGKGNCATVAGYTGVTESEITPDIASMQEEAIRVISSIPDWKPGKHKGEVVNVYFTMPINFKLQ